MVALDVLEETAPFVRGQAEQRGTLRTSIKLPVLGGTQHASIDCTRPQSTHAMSDMECERLHAQVFTVHDASISVSRSGTAIIPTVSLIPTVLTTHRLYLRYRLYLRAHNPPITDHRSTAVQLYEENTL